MTALTNHLEQISLSAAAISDLSFPLPKIFTNALLHQHDITALIRDTEVHERALFSVPAAPPQLTAQNPTAGASRRKTTYSTNPGSNEDALLGNVAFHNRGKKSMAITAVLGGDLAERIRRIDANGQDRSDIDIDILLSGADRLCRVYPIPGALDKISNLRRRHKQLESSITHHEARVERQTARLYEVKNVEGDQAASKEIQDDVLEDDDVEEVEEISEADLRLVEEETRQLERKKRMLEERVSGMEKDLGGLSR
ncbi:MAG: hypothetical protein M1814_001300 [Vezdaea aestivalis]|nr:MAG: hypothetical protein M1814_001300 [Vezdaea aestivalis]